MFLAPMRHCSALRFSWPSDVFTKRGNDPGCDETVDGVDGGKANDNDRAERHV